jgi:hypothetical protein
MMTDKLTINCTVHDGGKFAIIPKRGRRPSKCTEVNPCTAHPNFASIKATQKRVTKAAGLTALEGDLVDGMGRVARAASAIKNARQAEQANLEPASDDLDSMTAGELRSYARRIGASTLTKLSNADDLRRGLRKYLTANVDALTPSNIIINDNEHVEDEYRAPVESEPVPRPVRNPCLPMARSQRAHGTHLQHAR